MRTRIALLAALAVAALPGSAAAAGTPPGKLAAYGYHLYGRYCISCHAANGAGRTHAPGYQTGGSSLRTQARQGGIGPSLRGVGALAADFYLRTGYMPLPHVGVQPRRGRVLFDERQIRALVAYVASLGPGPPIPHPHPERGNLAEGLHLFTDHCAGCHQVVAQGGYVTGALPPPLEDATAVQIAEAVRIGPYVMPTFTKQDLSDAQLDSIVRYVEYAKHPASPGGWSLGFIGPVPEGLVTWFLAAVALIGLCVVIGERMRAKRS
ncbi:MAG TPA: c-type cytochrome [Gaiellaceae bacterium]|nr:c-type cytochrome [Gaiellaceae bacterium]